MHGGCTYCPAARRFESCSTVTAISKKSIGTTQRALAQRAHVARSSSPQPGTVTRRARKGTRLRRAAAAEPSGAPGARRKASAPGPRLRHEHHVGRIQKRVQRGAPRAVPQRPRARPRVKEDCRAGVARRGHSGHDHVRRQLVEQEAVDDQRARAPQRLHTVTRAARAPIARQERHGLGLVISHVPRACRRRARQV